MGRLSSFCVITVVFTGLASGAALLPPSLNAAVGNNVLFNPSLTPTQTPLHFIAWNFDTKNIVTFVAGTTVPGQDFVGRFTLSEFTGSLELRNLTLNDAGVYSFNIRQTAADEDKNGNTRLNIYEPVSNVTVAVSKTDLVEFIDTVTLSCSASGSSLTFLWFSNSVEVTVNDRINITDGGAALTIVNVSRDDQGSYTCKVSNPVNSSFSESVQLSVSYGPENVHISDPGQLQEGATLRLNCLAESEPAASFSWTKNGTTLGQSQEFTKDDITLSDRGVYVCRAKNNITEKTSQASRTVDVKEIIPSTGGCSTGCIVGIVLGCIAVVLIVAGGVFYALKKKKQKPKSNTRTDGVGQDNSANGENQEVQYADVRFVKKDGVVVQLSQQNNTEYAEVRKNNRPPSHPPTYDAHMQREGRRAAPEPPTLYSEIRPK